MVEIMGKTGVDVLGFHAVGGVGQYFSKFTQNQWVGGEEANFQTRLSVFAQPTREASEGLLDHSFASPSSLI